MKKGKKVLLGLGTVVLTSVVGTGIFMLTDDQDGVVKVDALEPHKVVSTEIEKKVEKEQEEVDAKDVKKEEKDVVTEETAPEVKDKEKVEAAVEVKKENVVKEVEKEVKKETELPRTSVEKEKKEVLTTKPSTSTESIAFKTVRQNDSSLEKGKEVVIQEGKNGTRTITHKNMYVNGDLVKTETTASITQKPVDRIIKVGTKENNNAEALLIKSGVFAKSGNTYQFDDSVTVNVQNGRVTNITFDRLLYFTIKDATLQEMINDWGEELGSVQHDRNQSEIKQIKKAAQTAANAVYGTGTSQANALYNELINGGGKTLVLQKNF